MNTQHHATRVVEHEGWRATAMERGVLVRRADGATLCTPYADRRSPLSRASVFLPSSDAQEAIGLTDDVLVTLNSHLREVL